MERKTLAVGHPRRVPDFKAAWRKMSVAQRDDVLEWICAESVIPAGAWLPPGWVLVHPEGDRSFGAFDPDELEAQNRSLVK